MATLTGTITAADGTPYTKHVRFTLRNQPQVRGTAVIDHDPVDVECDEDGELSTSLVIGEYWVQVKGGKPFRIVLPEDSTYDLADVITPDSVIASLFRLVYLHNSDTGLWHYIKIEGEGIERGIVFDSTGTSSPPLADPANHFDSLYLYNPSTGLYHQITLTGTDDEIGLTFDVTGTASPSAGLYSNGLLLWSHDEDQYRKLTCYGSGDEIGLLIT